MIGAFALACGPGDQRQAAPATSERQPRYGGQLNVTDDTDPDDWDITVLGGSGPNWYGISLSHNSLLGLQDG